MGICLFGIRASVVAVASIIVACIFSTTAIGQTTLYLPGTGTIIQHLDFESPALQNDQFDYGQGWAGQGFGLSGTQRGAPEVVNVKANPTTPAGSGLQGLAFNSQTRDSQWYAANPSAVGTTVYGGNDATGQDDFFMYAANWTASETPTVMSHVWLAESATYTSLRMPVIYGSNSTSSWPGMWLHHDFIDFRGPGRQDLSASVESLYGLDATERAQGRWWTLGLSVTPNGDLQYFAAPEYVTSLTSEHFIASNSELSANAGAAVNFLTSNSDAILMSSNRNFAADDQTFFDNLIYTKNANTAIQSNAILGDCNQDGDVNFLDISPMIGSLTTGIYLAEADCNQDGFMTFLDISPFIGILSGN